MSARFDPDKRAIIVDAELIGPRRVVSVSLTLDTGAMRTTIRPRHLIAAGYDADRPDRPVVIRSVTGESRAGINTGSRFEALDHHRLPYSVIAHEFPSTVTVDGVLGLDFFRGLVLTLDFARGRISLTPPRAWWRFWR